MDTSSTGNSTLSMELRKLGLSQKEAVLYLLALEKNEVTASQLAHDASISRPTVYRILADLEKRNLIKKTKKGTKTLFVAASPNALLNLFKIRKREAEEQEREFLRIISTLQTTYTLKKRGDIKEYDISKDTSIFINEIVRDPTDTIFILYNSPHIPYKTLEKSYEKMRKHLTNLTIHEIIPHTQQKRLQKNYIQTKKASLGKESFSIVITDRILILTKSKLLVIDHKETAETLTLPLRILWATL